MIVEGLYQLVPSLIYRSLHAWMSWGGFETWLFLHLERLRSKPQGLSERFVPIAPPTSRVISNHHLSLLLGRGSTANILSCFVLLEKDFSTTKTPPKNWYFLRRRIFWLPSTVLSAIISTWDDANLPVLSSLELGKRLPLALSALKTVHQTLRPDGVLLLGT